MSWHQASASLIVGGNSSTIRRWDLNREQCVRYFQTGSDSCLTALASLQTSPKGEEPDMNSFNQVLSY